jgi:hypothetical protein
MERVDSKFEAQNSKFETNPNVPNLKDFSLFGGFEPLDFGFFNSSDLFGSGYAGLGFILLGDLDYS